MTWSLQCLGTRVQRVEIVNWTKQSNQQINKSTDQKYEELQDSTYVRREVSTYIVSRYLSMYCP